MKIFDRLKSWFIKRQFKPVFKEGDRVRCKSVTSFWQKGVVNGFASRYNGENHYYVLFEDQVSHTPMFLEEDDLELLPPEMLEYDPNQQGDTDDDI